MTKATRPWIVALAFTWTMAPAAAARQAIPRSPDGPPQVLVLADRSESMSVDYSQLIPAALQHKVRPLPDLRVELPRSLSSGLRKDAAVQFASFGRTFMFSRFVGPDQRALQAAMAETEQSGGPSPIWDAMSRAATSLAARDGHRIVLLITDGRASGNVLSFDDALKGALAANVRVFVFDMHNGSDLSVKNRRVLDDPDGPNRDLRRIVVNTNGAYVAIDRFNRRTLPSLVESTLRELSASGPVRDPSR